MENERPPMYTGYNRALKEKARELRKNMTKQERHLWYDFLGYRQENWKRQRAIDGYIVDFFCYSARLVIERYQLEVMRFLNSEVDRNFDYVCLAIEEKVRERTGSPF